MSTFPAELWMRIFSFLSIPSLTACSDSDLWAKIVTDNMIEGERRILPEYDLTNRALLYVSKSFYELSQPLVFECISLRKLISVQCLARALKENPRLANTVNRYTKRLDIRITNPTMLFPSGNLSTMHIFFADLSFIYNLCSNLTYFSCHVYGVINYDTSDILRGFLNARPSLEVLRCTNIELSSLFSGLGRLRILDLTATKGVMLASSFAYELPFLHTLIGPLDVICPNFHNVPLPSLRTLVCKPSNRPFLVLEENRFFGRHGEKIESLELSSSERILVEICPNVKELIVFFGFSGIEHRSFILSWPNVLYLGIVVRDHDEEKERFCVELLLDLLRRIDSERQRRNYQKLRAIRINNSQAVRLLREGNRRATRLCERRLRGWDIRLEDDLGDLVLPPSA